MIYNGQTYLTLKDLDVEVSAKVSVGEKTYTGRVDLNYNSAKSSQVLIILDNQIAKSDSEKSEVGKNDAFFRNVVFAKPSAVRMTAIRYGDVTKSMVATLKIVYGEIVKPKG